MSNTKAWHHYGSTNYDNNYNMGNNNTWYHFGSTETNTYWVALRHDII